MPVNGVLFLLLFFLVYYLPGRFLFELLPGPRRAEETFVISIGLGIVCVNVISMMVVGIPGLYWPVFLTRGIVMGVSALLSIVLVGLLHRRSLLAGIQWFARPSRTVIAILVLTMISTAFFLVRFRVDGFNDDSCAVRVITSAVSNIHDTDLLTLNTGGAAPNEAHIHWTGSQGINPFLRDNQSQRLGIPVLVSPFVALFGTFGFRIVYALQGLLMPGLGFLLGLYLLKRWWAAALVALFLTFNPYSIESRLFDENFMAACFGALSLVLLLRTDPQPLWAGAAMSLFLGIRHIGLLALPVMVWYVFRRHKASMRPVMRFLIGLVVFGLPYLILHGFLFLGRGDLFEGAMDGTPLPHSILGLDFMSGTMWNYPMVEEPVRSPYLAYPNAIEVPLDILRRFGLFIAALVPAGLVYLFRQDRRNAWLMLGWFVPIVAIIMLKSDWVEPNKMGVPATVLAPAVIIIVAGLACLVDSSMALWRRLAFVAIGLALPVAFFIAARDYRAPMDERIYEYPLSFVRNVLPDDIDHLVKESPEFVEFDRKRLALKVLPRVDSDGLHPAVVRLRLAQMAEGLRRPELAEFKPPILTFLTKVFSDLGRTVNPLSLAKVREGGEFGVGLWSNGEGDEATRTLSLDLENPPAIDVAPFKASDASTEPLKLEAGVVYEVKGFHRPWSARPLSLIITRDEFGTVVFLLISSRPDSTYVPSFIKVVKMDASRFENNRIPVSLPLDTPIMIAEIRGFVPTRGYARTAVVEAHGLWLSSPYLMPL